MSLCNSSGPRLWKHFGAERLVPYDGAAGTAEALNNATLHPSSAWSVRYETPRCHEFDLESRWSRRGARTELWTIHS